MYKLESCSISAERIAVSKSNRFIGNFVLGRNYGSARKAEFMDRVSLEPKLKIIYLITIRMILW